MSDLESISLSISRDDLQEEMSISYAALEEARSQKQESISNEQIKKGDSIIDTYEVTSDAISGGMGSVWKVYHKDWNTDLAMKRPQPRFFAEGSEKRKEAFIKECENWINLGLHPNIVSCYYVREIGGVPTIFSEWMDGGSLKDVIQSGALYEGTKEEINERILDIAIQTARGLLYSHDHGLIHQDVKPGNILLTKHWEAKVADFGLAQAQSHLTEDGAAHSSGYTLEYCPKEQAEGQKPQAWMDLYSWALTVLEMYAGKRLWKTGADAGEKLGECFSSCRITIPKEVQELLKGILLYKPQHDGETDLKTGRKTVEKLEEIYVQVTGTAYPRPASKAAADNADSLNNKALSYLDLGKKEEAERLWEKSAVGEIGHPESLYNYALMQWISGKETDLNLLNEISKVSDKEKRETFLRDTMLVRHESQDDMPEEDVSAEKGEDWTESNSYSVAMAAAHYGKDGKNRWILGRDGISTDKKSMLYEISADGKKPILKSETFFYSRPSISIDGSVLLFYGNQKFSVFDCDSQEIILSKKMPEESVLSYCAGQDKKTCYLGREDGLYEYCFETEEMKLLLSVESGIYSIKHKCNGKWLLVCDGKNKIIILDRVENKVCVEIPTTLSEKKRFDDVLEFSGTYDITDDNTILFVTVNNELYRYSFPEGKLLNKDALPDTNNIIWSVLDRYILSGQHDFCQIWDIEKKICLRSFRMHAVQAADFLQTESSKEGYLEGFVLSGFPSRYRYFQIPAELPKPIWSLCKIHTTVERVKQDDQFSDLILKTRGYIKNGDYKSARDSLSAAREIPGMKNVKECWDLYDELYPHFQKGKLTESTVLYDFGKKYSDDPPIFSPDGKWFFYSWYRSESEIWSSADGKLLKKIDECSSDIICDEARRVYLEKGKEKNQWFAKVCQLPEAKVLLEQEFKAGRTPNLKKGWSNDGRLIVIVIEPSMFNGKVHLCIDPENAKIVSKNESKGDVVFLAAKKNQLPYSYVRRNLSNGLSAFLYKNINDKHHKNWRRMDLYDASGKLVRRVDFNNLDQTPKEEITSPSMLTNEWLIGKYKDQLYLYRIADFLETEMPEGQLIPVKAESIRNTALSENGRVLFGGGKVYRLEWELLDKEK